jgi:hypothetical protein
MEARTAFRSSAVTRNLVAVVAAMLVAFVLGVAGGYLISARSFPVAAPSVEPLESQKTPNYTFIGTHVPTQSANLHPAALHPSNAVGPATRQSASCAGVTIRVTDLRPSAAGDRSAAEIAAALCNAGCRQ